MLPTKGYAVKSPTAKFEPFHFERRELGPHDILIKILYCGVCHSDIHQARDGWGGSTYPMVPGHEIIGQVVGVGSSVKKFKVDDVAGVGCFVDSCRTCENCKSSEEQFCESNATWTYNCPDPKTNTTTYGGYSSQIVVDENYALHIKAKSPFANIAPLLCAGITTYSPLHHYNVGPGKRVAILGLGGLGHMGVKIAASMGAEVTVLSTSPSKEKDARRLGAHQFIVTTDPKNTALLTNYFDVILDAVSAPHDLDFYLNMLRKGGAMVLVGIPEKKLDFGAFSLIRNRRILTGSSIGGIKETQEMLDYCAEKNIVSDVEIIPIQKIDEAYERVLKSDVHYRFVIDMNSL